MKRYVDSRDLLLTARQAARIRSGSGRHHDFGDQDDDQLVWTCLRCGDVVDLKTKMSYAEAYSGCFPIFDFGALVERLGVGVAVSEMVGPGEPIDRLAARLVASL